MNYLRLRTLFLRRFHIPKSRTVRKTIHSFTLAEKAVFYFFVSIFIFSGLSLLWRVNASYLVEIPTRGGTLSEGIIGNPRFINPVLALSEADRSLSALIFSGLVRVSPTGDIHNDLAESIIIEDGGLTYRVSIRRDAYFHDGTPVIADDVIFTIQKITDQSIKSPRRGNWEGVTIEKIDDRTVLFHLKKAYAPFMENLSLGILPKHIWKNVSEDEFTFSQFNTLPIGSGPYVVSKVERNQGGIPNYYILTPFERSVGGTPYIRKLVFRFYSSEDALFNAYNKGEIESVGGVSPEKVSQLTSNRARVVSSPLPRVFGVFFNQNQSKVLLNKEVREALDLSAPKESIVSNILHGHATPIDGPLPAGIYDWAREREILSQAERLEEARHLLRRAGWYPNAETGVLEKKVGTSIMKLSFSISTGDAPELKAVATELVNVWRQLGAKVEVLVFETGDLNQNVIRPRKFDALLFGTVVGRDADVYPFWHSSQRNDPGLNIAMYANATTDKLLEEARTESDPVAREEKLMAFQKEILRDLPAVFLYSPSFLYMVPDKVEAASLGAMAVSQDRFLSIKDWYIETDKIWEIFNRSNR
jgi:peptide/nickel transport system substrate-binding protein